MGKIEEPQMSEEELRNLLEYSECATFVLEQGMEFKVVYANPKFYQILRYTKEEFADQFENKLKELILPEEKQKISNLIARQSVAGGHIHLEYRIKRKDGVVRFLSMTASPFVRNDKMCYYCSAMDVTQQRRTLAEVYDAKRQVDLITNNVPGGVIKIRISDFSILYSNDGFYRLAGYSRSEYFSLFGNHCDKVIYDQDAERVAHMIRAAVDNGGTISFEYRIIAKNGEVRWSYVNGCRVDDLNGEVVYLCIIMDITAKKKLEQKMADGLRRSGYLLEYMKETEWTYHIISKKLYRNGYIDGTYSRERELQNAFTRETLSPTVHPDDLDALCAFFDERMHEIGKAKGVFKVKDSKGNYHPTEVYAITVGAEETGMPERIYGETRFLDDRSFVVSQEPAVSLTSGTVGKVLKIAEMAREKVKDVVTGSMPYQEWIERTSSILKNNKEEKYGILCCDIDGFQRLTYHYGISIGNELLTSFAKLLCKHMAYDNMCSRISGDYFVVFFKYEKHGELLKRVSHMLRMQKEREKELSYNTYGTTSGIYLVKPGEQDLDKMLECADLARRSIKGTRGNHYSIYTEELQRNQFLEEEVISEIGTAMMEQSIEICYLPRIYKNRDNVIGCKAIPQIHLRICVVILIVVKKYSSYSSMSFRMYAAAREYGNQKVIRSSRFPSILRQASSVYRMQ